MSFNITCNPFSPLRHVHANLSGRMTYFIGGGGKQQTPTDQTITQTNIPEQFMPYYDRLLGRVESLSNQPYQAYGGSRLAASDQFADIGTSQGMVRGIAGQGITGLDAAQLNAAANASKANALGNYAPGQFSEYGYGPARQFTGAEVNQYMSPYMQNVVDFQKAGAVQDFERLRGGRNARAVQAGAFGGSRQGVQEGLAEEALTRQLGGIEATGRQSAYEQASSQFGQDRAAQLAQAQAQAAELGRVQTGTEASRQFGAGQGLAAIGASQAAGTQLVGLGEKERETQIQNAQLLDAMGRSQQAEAQAGLDIGYQDYLRQQGYPAEQIALMSNVIQGLPVQNAGTTTQTGSTYTNPAQQALGAGISALGLYKAYQ
jgi:hypothetical protein